MNRLTLLLLLLPPTLAGCAKSSPKANTDKTVAAENVPFFPKNTRQLDAVPEVQLIVQLSIYQIAVPARTISHNEDFWKHVDEHAVDVGTYDLLFANGFRVGVAPQGDWDYFKNILEENTVVSQKTGATGMVATAIEMPLKQNVPEQFVTWFHPTNGLTGQLYDRCDDAMTVRFEPVRRKPGDVRVTVTPMLRSQRTEIMYTVRNEAQQLDFVRPEHLFDMKLAIDIPVNSFLIVAPSSAADDSTILGHKFLYTENKGQEFEQLLVISPQPFQFEKPPTTAPATRPALTASKK